MGFNTNLLTVSGWCSTLFLLLICCLFGRENDHTLTHLLVTKHRPVIKSCKYATSPKNSFNIFPIGKSLVNIIQSITTRINHDSKSRGIWYISIFSNLPKPLRSENGRFVTKILHRYKQNMINDICTWKSSPKFVAISHENKNAMSCVFFLFVSNHHMTAGNHHRMAKRSQICRNMLNHFSYQRPYFVKNRKFLY